MTCRINVRGECWAGEPEKGSPFPILTPTAGTENGGTYDPRTCVTVCVTRTIVERKTACRTRPRGPLVVGRRCLHVCSGRKSRPARTYRVLSSDDHLYPGERFTIRSAHGREKWIATVSRPPPRKPFWSLVDILTNVSRGPRRKRPSVTDGAGDLICLTRTTRNRLKSPWSETVRKAYTIIQIPKRYTHGNDLKRKPRRKKRCTY